MEKEGIGSCCSSFTCSGKLEGSGGRKREREGGRGREEGGSGGGGGGEGGREREGGRKMRDEHMKGTTLYMYVRGSAVEGGCYLWTRTK